MQLIDDFFAKGGNYYDRKNYYDDVKSSMSVLTFSPSSVVPEKSI